MNPVPVMKLVELVRGIATDEKTFSAAKEFVGTLEKTITVAEDFPAFIVNRILLPMINEAIYTLYEGVGSVDSIDTAMRPRPASIQPWAGPIHRDPMGLGARVAARPPASGQHGAPYHVLSQAGARCWPGSGAGCSVPP